MKYAVGILIYIIGLVFGGSLVFIYLSEDPKFIDLELEYFNGKQQVFDEKVWIEKSDIGGDRFYVNTNGDVSILDYGYLTILTEKSSGAFEIYVNDKVFMTISNMDGKIVTMKSMLFKGEEKVSIDTDLDGIPEKMMDQDFSNIMDFECY